MIIDRKLQNLILAHLKNIYSLERQCIDTWGTIQSFPGGEDTENLIANVLYLEEHGLLESGLRQSVDGRYSADNASIKITCKGIDFMEEDGGLSAILNCVTVKLHDESLARLEKFLARAPIESHVKGQYLAQLKSLPVDATKHLVLKLVDSALDNVPAALQLIQKALGLGC